MSEFANLALQYALLFQNKLQSEITLLYADEFSSMHMGEYPFGYYVENAAAAKKHVQELLQNYVERHVPPTARVATLVVEDSPARATVMTAEDIRADLIIMGTHGRHGLRRALLGSVTERVLKETDRPVMTVAPQLAPAGAEIKIGTILCPVNFTAIARQALEQASGLAEAFGAELVVLHVSDHGAPRLDSIEAQFSSWLDPLARGRTRYRQVIVFGDPAGSVLEAADRMAADLIVVGAQHKRFRDTTLIGTTTERITRFARRPVLTVIRKETVEQRATRHEEVAVLA